LPLEKLAQFSGGAISAIAHQLKQVRQKWWHCCLLAVFRKIFTLTLTSYYFDCRSKYFCQNPELWSF